jgi:protein-S-isoprenylcysteine O-methyltransferase Ste14
MMQGLQLKVPPVIVTLATALAMGLVAYATPTFRMPLPVRGAVSCALALGGLTTAVSGVIAFRRAGTTVNPMTPDSSSALVRSGIYRLTRNPMYLGFGLVLLAWAAFLSNVLAFGLLPAFVLYMNRYQIEPEERALAGRFGDDFAGYAARVRRWL